MAQQQNEPEAEDRSLRVLTAEGFRTVAYRAWWAAGGDSSPSAAGPTVVCVHGLTRNQRDFDMLARAAVLRGPPGTRVLTVDVPGRGRSQYLTDKNLYGYPLYCLAVSSVIEHETQGRGCLFVGTSMGGLIGMVLAGLDGHPLRRMVMNDVGPLVPRAALQRIAEYVPRDLRFPSEAAVDAYMRQRYAPYGAGMRDEFWAHLARHGSEPDGEGGLRLCYDLGIAVPFKADADAVMWPLWEKVSVPTLVLRGANSDLLSAETAARMAASEHADVRVVEFPGCGHTPPLMSPETGIDDTLDFLFGGGGGGGGESETA